MPTILVIDDSADMRELLDRMLRRAGFDVVSAANGRMGLALFKSARPELVITDILMPEMEGIETLRALKQEDPRVRIIAISGVDMTVDYLRMATWLGAAEALQKPVERACLIETVQRVLAAG
jgi:CheY-like chemotaxis protein